MNMSADCTSTALREVWAWKDSVYRETAGREFPEVQSYFADGPSPLIFIDMCNL
jgi:hypothetical protein